MKSNNSYQLASNEEILFLCQELQTNLNFDLRKRANILSIKIKNAITTEPIQKMINEEYLYLNQFSSCNTNMEQ